MKEDNNKYIEDLLERFFNGVTTNEEEQELYSYFKSENVSQSLIHYKPVFEYFESGLSEEVQKNVIGNPLQKTKTSKRIIYGIVSLVAASILAIFVFRPLLTQTVTSDAYEGSYIIQNGVKSYDEEKIHQEYISVQHKMEQKEREIENLMKESEYHFNKYN